MGNPFFCCVPGPYCEVRARNLFLFKYNALSRIYIGWQWAFRRAATTGIFDPNGKCHSCGFDAPWTPLHGERSGNQG
jgi:hypothetical protein